MEKISRLENANKLLVAIASCGRKFFMHRNRVSYFEIDQRGRIWFIDAYAQARIYTHYTMGRWHGFSEGGTLRALVIALRDYIAYGKLIARVHVGSYPKWYSDGDPWGYGDDMLQVIQTAISLGVVAPAEESAGLIGASPIDMARQTLEKIHAS